MRLPPDLPGVGGVSAWIYLSLAIASEVAATVALRQSESFTKLVPSGIVVVGYALYSDSFAEGR